MLAMCPQVLRRYLLHTRVTLGGGVAESTIDGVPTPSLDDRAAAIVAARELSAKPYYRYSRSVRDQEHESHMSR